MNQKVIYWFRQDLRLSDNPALTQACLMGQIIPIYILDHMHAGDGKLGSAARVWLHHALTSLHQDLEQKLLCYQADPIDILQTLCQQHQVKHVYWNRCYEPWRMERDRDIKSTLKAAGIQVHSDNGSVLWEPWTIQKTDGTPFKVFTPFYRKGCLQADPPRHPLSKPNSMVLADIDRPKNTIDALNLLPKKFKWGKTLATHWNMSEKGAHNQLQTFLSIGIKHYKEGRNFPAKPYTSQLSPYLRFGQISPNQVWYAALQLGNNADIDHFLSELGWREFSYHLLYHNHQLPTQNLQPKFDRFPWQEDAAKLAAWQTGNTGYPMVDAGMRQLWQTGYMHNRVRMIVGSFLVKNLLLHWHHGERWFWDCLVDADMASNSASWQWIAGCGADAAPYFRVFNPITQGQKFDPEGQYVKRFIPELKHLPAEFIHCPWQAPSLVLKAAGIQLGHHYPEPIVDVKASRQAALDAFAALKQDQ
ncbi:DNA photolyase family protein [Gammaproteobacteria bacterium]|nr:DNA photolyase family protein [Gammaproteobacteria bacterium]